MSGQIKTLVEQIILSKSRGDPVLQKMVKIKLLIKGIQADAFDEHSDDDPVMIERLCDIAHEFGLESEYFEKFRTKKNYGKT